mgnify:CR=1 FL=1
MEGVIIMLLSQMAADAAKDYKYDIILANVNGRLTEISDMDITDEKSGIHYSRRGSGK